MNNNNGDTPLHITCARGYKQSTKILIKSGAEILKRNRLGDTPQQVAEKNGFIKCVELFPSNLGMAHRIRNHHLDKDLINWYNTKGEEKEIAEKLTMDRIQSRGCHLNIDNIATVEQETMKNIIDLWNKTHTIKCKCTHASI
jgi:ankyrin repeat protein